MPRETDRRTRRTTRLNPNPSTNEVCDGKQGPKEPNKQQQAEAFGEGKEGTQGAKGRRETARPLTRPQRRIPAQPRPRLPECHRLARWMLTLVATVEREAPPGKPVAWDGARGRRVATNVRHYRASRWHGAGRRLRLSPSSAWRLACGRHSIQSFLPDRRAGALGDWISRCIPPTAWPLAGGRTGMYHYVSLMLASDRC